MSSTTDTLTLVRQALARAGSAADLAKAATFTQPGTATTGLQPYDLEGPAKNLVPWLSPLRNRIPRVSGRGGSQANWKAVTAVNSAQMNAGVAEGRRGGQINITTADYFAAYRTIGLEDSVTVEAELSAEGFDDLRARAVTSLLQATMVEEEKIILGGNATLLLGTTPTPTLTTATSGGSIANATAVSVIAVALTFDALRRFSVAGGLSQTISRSNMDGTTETINGGTAQPSAAAAVTTGGSTSAHTVTAKVAPVRGAFGYAWYAGLAGAEKIAAITTVSQVLLTALPGSGQAASALAATDYSRDTLIHDGLLCMAGNATLNSYYKALTAGSSLTPDGSGGIVEIDDMLQNLWDNLRIVPDRFMISSQEARTLKKIVTQGGTSAALARFTMQVVPGSQVGGGNFRGYLTAFGDNREIPFEQHPYMPAGAMLAVTEKLPYPMNNVSNVMQIKYRRDYYQYEWPQRTRQYEYGVYSDQVLQHYFPPSMGLISNISPG